MHRIIDTCYGQNLGLEEHHTGPGIIASVLKVEEELDNWRARLGELHMHVYDAPITVEDLEKKDVVNKSMERLVNVLSVRYHNLQILLHRPVLETFLEACGCSVSAESSQGRARGRVHKLGIGDVETCVHSATVIISIVHTVVRSTAWRRDLLGAWNYSLFYSKPILERGRLRSLLQTPCSISSCLFPRSSSLRILTLSSYSECIES